MSEAEELKEALYIAIRNKTKVDDAIAILERIIPDTADYECEWAKNPAMKSNLEKHSKAIVTLDVLSQNYRERIDFLWKQNFQNWLVGG